MENYFLWGEFPNAKLGKRKRSNKDLLLNKPEKDRSKA